MNLPVLGTIFCDKNVYRNAMVFSEGLRQIILVMSIQLMYLQMSEGKKSSHWRPLE